MLAEDLAKQLRRAVGYPSLTGEVRGGVDEDDHSDNPLNGVQPTGHVSCRSDGVKSSGAGSLSGLLSGNSGDPTVLRNSRRSLGRPNHGHV